MVAVGIDYVVRVVKRGSNNDIAVGVGSSSLRLFSAFPFSFISECLNPDGHPCVISEWFAHQKSQELCVEMLWMFQVSLILYVSKITITATA